MGHRRRHNFTHQEQLNVVREYLTRRENSHALAERVGIPVHTLYAWASKLRGEVLYSAETPAALPKPTPPAPPAPAVKDESSIPLRGEMTLKFDEYMAMRSFLNRFETMVRNIAPPV